MKKISLSYKVFFFDTDLLFNRFIESLIYNFEIKRFYVKHVSLSKSLDCVVIVNKPKKEEPFFTVSLS